VQFSLARNAVDLLFTFQLILFARLYTKWSHGLAEYMGANNEKCA